MLVKKNAFWPFEFDKSLSIIYLPKSIFQDMHVLHPNINVFV